MSYPNHLTVISPMFGVINDAVKGGHSSRLVYLLAFAVLIVTRDENGKLTFRQQIDIDPTQARSIPILEKLGEAIDPDTVLAGFRLDHVVGSLIRVPRDSEEEERGKRPLMQILLALGQEPIDAYWLDQGGGLDTLRQVDILYELGADWDEPGTTYIAAKLRQQLAARAQSIWLAIAVDRMEEEDGVDAIEQFLEWKKGEANELATTSTD